MKHALVLLSMLPLVLTGGCGDDSSGTPANPDVNAFPTTDMGLGETAGGDVWSPEDVAPTLCTTDLDCSTDNECMVARCQQPEGICFEEPSAFEKECGGDDPCITGQTCQAGACVGGENVSCDDNNPCTEDSCVPGNGCMNTPVPDCCVPQCDGKECGLDGCGGICGECQDFESCVDPGVCISECEPDCAGKNCGSDGCGGFCGTCPVGLVCNAEGVCSEGCDPNCAGKECGSDGCGGVCGNCPAGWSCDFQDVCVEDGCQPNCAGKECGPDGCGGICGNCGPGESCSFGACQAGCTPNCAGKECGPDGCGGFCGAGCAANEACNNQGMCIDVSAGNDCASAIEVNTVPFAESGSTDMATNSFSFGSNECEGETSGLGGASADRVYVFSPPVAGNYTVSLTSNFDAVLYVASDCGNVSASCLSASDEAFVGSPEEITLYFPKSPPTYIIVDGYSNFSNISGNYSLEIDKYANPGCTPDCAGKSCGEDGCGGQCGACINPGEICDPTGACNSPGAGDSCADPFVVESFPFKANGTTVGATNLYAYSYEECPGTDSGAGDGSNDHVYLIEPAKSGNYEFILDNDFDAAMYLVTNCGDVDGSCVMGAEETGSWGEETFVAYMEKWTSYYLIVDGAANFTNYDGAYGLSIATYTNPGCVPDCTGKVCGSDDCGGFCGTCTKPGDVCDATGQCTPKGTGDTCSTPFEVNSVPFKAKGDTTGTSNDYSFGDDVCPGASNEQGDGSSDQVYAFTPPKSGNYEFTVDSDYDATLYLVQDCLNIDGTCLAGSEQGSSWIDETFVVYLNAFETVYLVVDGYSNFSNTLGPYELTITSYVKPGCTPKCAGKSCGDDGCGGQCGLCQQGLACGAEGQCQDPDVGNICEMATTIKVGDTLTGDTSLGTNDYHFKSNKCPGVNFSCGKGGKDQAYVFTPPMSGSYSFELDATFDSVIYMVTDCSDIDDTCVGADEAFGIETLVAMLEAGQTYYVIVDGYSNSWDYSGPYTLSLTGP